MTSNHTKSSASQKSESSASGKSIWEDLNSGAFRRSVERDVEEAYELYLDTDTRKRLSKMSDLDRSLHMVYWVLRGCVLRLSPIRRVLFVVSLAVFVFSLIGLTAWWWLFAGFLVLLFILLLELKDKLLAQDELASGRAVQFALMPRESPELPGWETWLYTRPANDVGGDLVDYLPVRDGCLGISLGDVAGKGLPAALFMAKLQSTIRAIAPRYSSLAELGAEINSIFRRDGLPDRFASLVYLEVEQHSGRIRLLNAGHFPPIVVGTNGVKELPRGAPALGLSSDVTFAELSVELAPGELLLVYSDGLTEARNQEGGFFGSRRLMKLLKTLPRLTAEEAGSRLLSVLDRFVGEARPTDDLSLVLLRRAPDYDLEEDTFDEEQRVVVERS